MSTHPMHAGVVIALPNRQLASLSMHVVRAFTRVGGVVAAGHTQRSRGALVPLARIRLLQLAEDSSVGGWALALLRSRIPTHASILTVQMAFEDIIVVPRFAVLSGEAGETSALVVAEKGHAGAMALARISDAIVNERCTLGASVASVAFAIVGVPRAHTTAVKASVRIDGALVHL